jgi:hypothetical protein
VIGATSGEDDRRVLRFDGLDSLNVLGREGPAEKPERLARALLVGLDLGRESRRASRRGAVGVVVCSGCGRERGDGLAVGREPEMELGLDRGRKGSSRLGRGRTRSILKAHLAERFDRI